MQRSEVVEAVDALYWHHSIDLGDGVVTPGGSEIALGPPQLPDFAGRTVLDIGAWDGYYSFAAEAAGASRVVALDHYVWGVDMTARNRYWAECAASGAFPDMGRDLSDFWRPDLPGKRGFDLARKVRSSGVESVVGDFATVDLEPLGTFDVVLFLGVLYHLPEPFTALQRLRRVTGQVAVIETEALHIPAASGISALEFTAGRLGAHDYGNWFTPTVTGLTQMCRAAGFSRVEVLAGPPPDPVVDDRRTGWRRRSATPEPPPGPLHYRAVVHAWA